MELARLEVEYNKVKNLKQYKNYTEPQLRQLAYRRAIEHQVDINSLFLDKNDRKEAQQLLKKYLDDYMPETVSDINTLGSILFLEIINFRLQQQLNKDKESNEDVDIKTVETIHKNLNQILILKESLGLTGVKKSSNVKSLEQKIALMRKQFRVWCDQNQASREVGCPYCKQQFLLMIRTDSWEAKKHPYFRDRVLGSVPLVNLYFKNRITKKDVANILECSEDYVDWLIEKWKLNPEFQK